MNIEEVRLHFFSNASKLYEELVIQQLKFLDARNTAWTQEAREHLAWY